MKPKVLAIIPARGGSKGLPGKNIKLLSGKPLIAHAIDCAYMVEDVEDVVVSTDSDEIGILAEKYNASYIKRPDILSGDQALVMDAIRYTLDYLEQEGKLYDIFLLLEPTAPLRLPTDIEEVLAFFENPAVDAVATFSETHTPPTRLWKVENNDISPFIDGANPFLPRQQHKKGYFLNGLVYALKIDTLKKNPSAISLLLGNVKAVVTPVERAIDIDTEIDFLVAEEIMKTKKW